MLTDSLTIGVASFLAALGAALLLRWAGARPTVAWATGVGCGFVTGMVAIKRYAGWLAGAGELMQPQSGSDWLPLAVLFAVGVTVLAAYAEREWRPIVAALGAVVTIAVVARLFAGHMAQQWSLAEKVFWLILLSSVLAGVWAMLASARAEEQPLVRTALLAIVALGAAVATTVSGSFTYGQMCGAVVAALLGAAVASLGNSSGASGVAGVVTFSLAAVIVLCNFYAQLPALDAACLLAAVVLAGGRLPAFVMRLASWQQAAVRAAFCLTPFVVVLVRVAGRVSADPY